MSFIVLGIAASVFTMPVIWISYSENVIGRISGNKRRLCKENLTAWAKLLILGVVGGIVLAWMRYTVYDHEPIHVLIELFAYIWLLPVAQIDGRTRRIPNRWILYGFIGSVLFLIIEKIVGNTSWIEMGSGFIGALFGGGFFLLASLISNGGIGMGDAKMYMILGLLIGKDRIFALILITLVFALVHGLLLLLTKKGNHKTQVPLGPFAYVAMVVMLLMIK